MKFHVTKREQLAITAFLVPKPTANLEQAHVRMSAWDELDVKELAFQVAETASMPGAGIEAKPWMDNRTPILVDLSAAVVDWLLKGLEGEIPGVVSEVLRPMQDRLIALRDKNYKLPQELRSSAKAAEPKPE